MGAVNLDYLQKIQKPPQPQTGPEVQTPDVAPPPSGGYPYDPGVIGTFPGQVTQPGQWSAQPVARQMDTQNSGPSPFSGQGSFQDWFMGLANQAAQSGGYNQNWLLGMENLLGQSGSKLTPANSIGERTKIWDPQRNDWARVGFGEGKPVWIYQNWGAQGPQASQGGGVFNDPATSEWEALLRTINQRLQQPQPTYTDAQRELMQTQAIDPLERQRQVQKQNTMQRFAARGINPGSGILEQALQDVDRQFDQMRTGQQTSFALNQIDREDQLFNSNEQRALAGLNLFSQIPQLADRRLAAANGSLMNANPLQFLSLQNQIAQQGQQHQMYQNQQDQQFWMWLGQMLANSFAR